MSHYTLFFLFSLFFFSLAVSFLGEKRKKKKKKEKRNQGKKEEESPAKKAEIKETAVSSLHGGMNFMRKR